MCVSRVNFRVAAKPTVQKQVAKKTKLFFSFAGPRVMKGKKRKKGTVDVDFSTCSTSLVEMPRTAGSTTKKPMYYVKFSNI